MRGREEGSALVELVFVVTILFGMLFAMLDFALIQASDNAGTNAAREGARQAILDYACADNSCNPAQPPDSLQRITAKVSSRLGGLVAGTPTVVVRCWDGTKTGQTKNCDPTQVVAGVDQVEVDVTWKRLATSPYATVSTHTDSAVMTIDGSGQGTHATACQVVSSSVTPPQATIASGTSGQLNGSVTITVQTNGYCQPLYLSFSTGSTPDQATPVAMTSEGDGSFSFAIAPSAPYKWVPGTYNLNLSEGGQYPLKPSPAPVLTVSATAACSIVSASVGPSAVVLSGATSPSSLAQGVTLSVTTSSGCAGVNVLFTPNSGSMLTVPMTGTAPNFALVIGPSDYSWTVGSKNFAFTDSTGASLQPPASVILQVALRCAISVSLSPNTVHTNGSDGDAAVSVTATQTTGADCTGLIVTYAYSASSSATSPPMTQNAGVYTYTIPAGTNWAKGNWSMTFKSNNAPSVSTSPNPVQVTAS